MAKRTAKVNKKTRLNRRTRAGKKSSNSKAQRLSPLRVDGLSLRVEKTMAKINARDQNEGSSLEKSMRHEGDGRFVYLRNFKVKGKRKSSPGHFIIVLFDGGQFLGARGGCAVLKRGDGYSALKVGKQAFRIQSTRGYLFVDQSDTELPSSELTTSTLVEIETAKVAILENVRPELSQLVQTTDAHVGALLKILIDQRKVQEVSNRKLRGLSASDVLSAARVDARIKQLSALSFSDLRQLWSNAIRFCGERSTWDETRPVERLVNAIENEWDRRKIQGLVGLEDYFAWPTTNAESSGRSHVDFDVPVQGLLSYLEYHVGRTNGQPTKVRHAILERVFIGKLPPVFLPEYLAEWGEPSTANRLKKMAESIAAFTRNFKRHEKGSFDQAIQEWETDIFHLYEEYYVGKFNFGWPYKKSE